MPISPIATLLSFFLAAGAGGAADVAVGMAAGDSGGKGGGNEDMQWPSKVDAT
ncbi:hypothetical protein ABQ179_021135 [Xanthomonas dyei]|uniref:hypothetical protein n=1 Tax=Xanthomonas dyei TaxID=743699 RepID=UPI001FD5ABAE|nr:hypothetical protein [Xanthomonas dyei]